MRDVIKDVIKDNIILTQASCLINIRFILRGLPIFRQSSFL